MNIIIVIYNRNNEQKIKQCMDSVQDIGQYSTVVIDDASNDNSWEIINQYFDGCKIRNEFSVGPIAALFSNQYLWGDFNIVGLINSRYILKPTLIQQVKTYAGGIHNDVGIIFTDYRQDNMDVFQRMNPEIIFLTKKALEISNSSQTITNLCETIPRQLISLHIPEILFDG